MTLIYELDRKTGRHTDRQTDRHTDGQTDRQTDRQTDATEHITNPHSRMVINLQHTVTMMYQDKVWTRICRCNSDN